MSDSTEQAQETGTPAKVGPSESRRRLLRGGLGGAPLLMTLVSRPVLGGGSYGGGGGGGQCYTPSGFVSMPTSQPGRPQFCSGRTPGFWKQPQKFSEWPAPFYPTTTQYHKATKFNAYFSGIPSPYPSTATFLDVLNTQDGFSGPPHSVARHIVASVLNVAKGWVPVLTQDVIKAIWGQYMNTGGGTSGYYEPTAGVKWYHDDIVNYLTSTMTL